MDKSCASSYVYAKACGMLAKSFLGKNALILLNAKNLAEIWENVFHTPVPQVPEAMLATRLEKEASQMCVNQYISLIECYDKPPEFLVTLLQRFDVENLSAIVSALCIGEQNHPHPVRLGKYDLLDYTKWPDIKAITANSRFSWINQVPELKKMQRVNHTLDIQELHYFWHSLEKSSYKTRKELIAFFTEYYSLKNIVWALRLNVFYKMSEDEIRKNLLYVTDSVSAKDPICKKVLKILDKPIDSYEEWKDTGLNELLNPHEDGSVWKIDPLWIEHQIRVRQTKQTFSMFHKFPMTEIPLVMFFFLKLQEVNVIRASVERIRLGADLKDSLYAAGIQIQ